MADPAKLIAKYPELKGMPPQKALEIIYAKDFSDMPRAKFNEITGYSPSLSAGIKADIGYPIFKGMSEEQLSKLRGAYPQFKDQPNEKFIESVYQKDFKEIPKEKFYETIGYRTKPAEFVRGVGAGAVEPFIELSNLLNRGISKIPGAQVLPQELLGQITPPEWGAGAAYESGRGIGSLLPLLGGSAEIEAARGATAALQDVPGAVSQLAKYLGTPAGRALSSVGQLAGYGALTAPEDRLRGAELGALFGAGGEIAAPALSALGGAPANLVRKLTAPLSPQRQTEKILDWLGGTEDVPLHLKLQTNAEELAKDIKSTGQAKKAVGGKKFQDILGQIGDKRIYGPTMQPDAYALRPVDYEGDLQGAHEKFYREPTFENSHNLRSLLGKERRAIEDIQKRSPTNENRVKIRQLGSDRNALDQDMKSFLEKSDITGNFSNAYQKALQYWRQEAVPYSENPKIAEMVSGRVTQPANIKGIFGKPGKNPYGMGIREIQRDLGENLNRRILYSELGKVEKNPSGENLLKAVEKLGEQGLGEYVPDTFENQLSQLERKMAFKNIAVRGAGLALGGSLALADQRDGGMGGLLGGAGDLTGALLGMYLAPRIGRQLTKALGGGIAPKSLLEGITRPAESPLINLYRLISQGLTANADRLSGPRDQEGQ